MKTPVFLLFLAVLSACPLARGADEEKNLILDAGFAQDFRKFSVQPAFRIQKFDGRKVLRIEGVPHMGKEFNALQVFRQEIWCSPSLLNQSTVTFTADAAVKKLSGGSVRVAVTEIGFDGNIVKHNVYELDGTRRDWTPVRADFRMSDRTLKIEFAILACGLAADDVVFFDKLSLTRSGPVETNPNGMMILPTPAVRIR